MIRSKIYYQRRILLVLFSFLLLLHQASGYNYYSDNRFARRSEPVLAQENPDQVAARTDNNQFHVSPQDSNSVKIDTTPTPHKLMVGDWIAQWDITYKAWFFYNIKTEESTWVKPGALAHVAFNTPATDKKSVEKAAYATKRKKNKNERVFQSEPDQFFGFDTSPFSRKNLQEKGVVKAFKSSLDGIYDNIVKDYISSVFSGAIEDYVGATVKFVGWFVVGSAIVVSGAVINALNTGTVGGKRSFPGFGRLEGPEHNMIRVDLPFIQGIDMTFPYDESIFDCYKERETCKNRDLQGEIGHLIESVSTIKDFAMEWLQLGEQLGHQAMEGDYDDIQDDQL